MIHPEIGLEETTIFGFPYHGLTYDGELDLGILGKIQFSQAAAMAKGDARLLMADDAPDIDRTAEQQDQDAAHGWDWKNAHAIVGPGAGCIYDRPLPNGIVVLESFGKAWFIGIESTETPSTGGMDVAFRVSRLGCIDLANPAQAPVDIVRSCPVSQSVRVHSTSANGRKAVLKSDEMGYGAMLVEVDGSGPNFDISVSIIKSNSEAMLKVSPWQTDLLNDGNRIEITKVNIVTDHGTGIYYSAIPSVCSYTENYATVDAPEDYRLVAQDAEAGRVLVNAYIGADGDLHIIEARIVVSGEASRRTVSTTPGSADFKRDFGGSHYTDQAVFSDGASSRNITASHDVTAKVQLIDNGVEVDVQTIRVLATYDFVDWIDQYTYTVIDPGGPCSASDCQPCAIAPMLSVTWWWMANKHWTYKAWVSGSVIADEHRDDINVPMGHSPIDPPGSPANEVNTSTPGWTQDLEIDRQWDYRTRPDYPDLRVPYVINLSGGFYGYSILTGVSAATGQIWQYNDSTHAMIESINSPTISKSVHRAMTYLGGVQTDHVDDSSPKVLMHCAYDPFSGSLVRNSATPVCFI